VTAVSVAAIGGLSALWGYIDRYRWLHRGISLQGRQLGKGPYVTVKSPGIEGTADLLANVVAQARETSRQAGWAEPSEELNKFHDAARAARAKGACAEAIEHYAKIIHVLTHQLRHFIARRASDSAIDM
jgi:hypothetical protein